MKRLHALIGIEHDLSEVCRELKAVVRSLSPQAVGALLVTCSDESEFECADAFLRGFAQETLPRLKYGERVPFRIANPGARYEWGGAPIAEEHFATPESERGFKVVVAKINGHVAVTRAGGEVRFGSMARYGAESTYCGAVHAVLGGGHGPFVRSLRETLQSDGHDRLAALRDPARVDPALSPFYGALVNARLQARFLVQDIQEHTPCTPTLYVVLHGVTLNKPGPDTEVLGGVYTIDRRGKPRDRYRGLGDDPAAYTFEHDIGRLHVRDPEVDTERTARDHRKLAHERLATWRERAAEALPALRRTLTQARRGPQSTGTLALHSLLGALAAVAPVPLALALAAQGLAGVYELHRLGNAPGDPAQAERAQDVIETVRSRVERMPPEEAARVLNALVARLEQLAGPADGRTSQA
jgi:hypothetical protein